MASLEVSIFNEKSWVAKKIFGGLMGTVYLSLPADVLSRVKPKEPTKKKEFSWDKKKKNFKKRKKQKAR